MTIFRFSALVALAVATAAVATPIDRQPRNAVEAMLADDVDSARTRLTAWIVANASNRDQVVRDLLAAGFVLMPGASECRFYGYHERTDTDGSARSVQISLCDNDRPPIVLVLDFFPPDRAGPSFRAGPAEPVQ
jgi:hypothetical protein